MSSFVNVVYDIESIIQSITVEGHAGIKKSGEGYEVCIALSALTQAMYKAKGMRVLKSLVKVMRFV